MPDIKYYADQYAEACRAYDRGRSVISQSISDYNRVTGTMTDLLRTVLNEYGHYDVRIVL